MAVKGKGEPKVIVYTAEWCPWCHRAMDFLKANNIPFEARDVDTPVFAQESMEKSGQSGIPVIVIGKEVIVGFDEQKLRAVLRIK